MNEVTRLYNQMLVNLEKGIDDVVFMNISYPNNVISNIHVSWLDPHKIRKMTVVGSKKIELVIADSELDAAVEAIQTVARTGHIGDGKIFIYDIDEAIRIRTGERGSEAI